MKSNKANYQYRAVKLTKTFFKQSKIQIRIAIKTSNSKAFNQKISYKKIMFCYKTHMLWREIKMLAIMILTVLNLQINNSNSSIKA